jgi:hypothetical protein
VKKLSDVGVLLVGLSFALFAPGRLARAGEAQPAPASERPDPADRADEAQPDHLRLGAIAGVGFPRPLAVEAMAVFERTVAVGLEYGVMPSLTINGVNAGLWSLAGDARVFPLRGAFFLGLRAGLQHLDAATQITAGAASAQEALGLDTWFVNPRLGFLWTFKGGLTFGVEAGVQIPIGNAMSSTLPLSLVPGVQRTADALASSVIPTVDLFRLGLLL